MHDDISEDGLPAQGQHTRHGSVAACSDGPASSPDDDCKPVVAMIHVGALPGTPGNTESVSEIVRKATEEAHAYTECGVHCLMIENMHDIPYLPRRVGPEIIAAMTMVAQAIRAETHLPIGIQILAGADEEALAVAYSAELDFIRAECFSYAHIADEGMMNANAGSLLRYRRMIGASDIQVWADIKKKHSSHAITADINLGDAAETAEAMGAETLIVTGLSTGRPPRAVEVEEARGRCQAPVFVGSGVNEDNLETLLAVSDGVIVGSHFKHGGRWMNAVDGDRVKRFMEHAMRINKENAEAALQTRGAAPNDALMMPPGVRRR